MEFNKSKLIVQEFVAVIYLIDDVFKKVILIYNLIRQVYNVKKKGRYVSANMMKWAWSELNS